MPQPGLAGDRWGGAVVVGVSISHIGSIEGQNASPLLCEGDCPTSSDVATSPEQQRRQQLATACCDACDRLPFLVAIVGLLGKKDLKENTSN